MVLDVSRANQKGVNGKPDGLLVRFARYLDMEELALSSFYEEDSREFSVENLTAIKLRRESK